ncbi:ABC transporter ATP-binding protein [Rhizobium leguminosarum]
MTIPAAQLSATADIDVRGLWAGYDGVRVLNDVAFSIERGETVAIMGRNGAGKSTLAASLFGLEPELGGHIAIKGNDVRGWPTHRISRLGIALVPQGRGVFADLTIDQNLEMASLWSRRLRSRAWTKERVYDEFPRLTERRNFQSGSLSGGERQLLAIARALLTQADIIVLDEPSEGLSPRAIDEVIIGTVGRLRGDGYTLLIAEQNITLALALAKRALVLDHGSIVYDGPSASLVSNEALQREHLGLSG